MVAELREDRREEPENGNRGGKPDGEDEGMED